MALYYAILQAAAATSPQLSCPSGLSIGPTTCVPPGVSPLEFYVQQPDPSYTYDKTPLQTIALPNATAFVFNMTSQTWLADDIFAPDSPTKSVWCHQLTVIVPDAFKARDVGAPPPKASSHTAWLWITGGGRPFTLLSASNWEVALAGKLSVATNTIGAVLKQVPNQAVKFAEPLPHPSGMYPNRERTEDGIISYGWHRFIAEATAATRNHTGTGTAPLPPTVDARWLLRLPMTKAVVRAMDTITTIAAVRDVGRADGLNRYESIRIEDFVVGGMSKRGWTTWTTGLVEPKRCRAIVPVVMDLLKLVPNTDRTFEALGGWTFEYEDYIAAGVVGKVVHSPAYETLASIIDPYAYFEEKKWKRARAGGAATPWLTMPKLVVNAGNDEFFLPADNHLWWDSLPGEKHVLHIENADHGLNFVPPKVGKLAGRAVFESSLASFYKLAVAGSPRSHFDWAFESSRYARVAGVGGGNNASGAPTPETLTVVLSNFSSPPSLVTLWVATSADGERDFRLFSCRTGPSGNCTLPEADPTAPPGVPGAPVAHPVEYFPTKLIPSSVKNAKLGGVSFTATVAAPSDGNYSAFLVAVDFASTGEHYTTQMGVVPAAYPYQACGVEQGLAGGCGRLV